MKKITFLFLLLIPFLGVAQTGKSTDYRKIGVGIGLSSHSVVSDSIRPIELSLRYRIGDKHTIQLYSPVSYRKTSLRDADNTRKETLWGIGLGYDYTFYTHSQLDFFAGLSGGYQWYQDRYDENEIDRRHDEDYFYDVDTKYYYWDKVKGFNIGPNIGVRFSVKKITSEIKINIPFTKLRKESYVYYHEIVSVGSMTFEWNYPNRKINELKVNANIMANISYYF